jgi:hypothetical protein
MSKPHVRYADLGRCTIGGSAWVFVCDHPRCKSGWKTTSEVLGIIERLPNGPVFETLNTIYHPAPTDETFPSSSGALKLIGRPGQYAI